MRLDGLLPQSFSSSPLRIIVDIHRRGPLQQQSTTGGDVSYNGRRAPATTNPPTIHKPVVDVDATVLGSGSSLASGGF